jgi:pyruvate,orthophosphate dikinase
MRDVTSRRNAPGVRRYVHTLEEEVVSPALLGGKGASLARMRSLGLPTPPAFTVTTDGWRAYGQAEGAMPERIAAEIDACLGELEDSIGRRFGAAESPLLVSVRSGAPVSMPGMMDTVLNLGMNDAVVAALATEVDEDFAWGLYRRLLGQFATVVRGLASDAVGAAEERAARPQQACKALTALIEEHGEPFPQDGRAQLFEAVEAVWKSWDGRRARRYRAYAGISDDLGTAVTVQAMVFGTYDDDSGTGVVFTRDPATGSPGAYGDYLPRAQGEDVVAGSHQTEPLEALRTRMPAVYAELEEALPRLEAEYRDMCDVEFTVERGRLWILQARVGQRSGPAAVRIGVDLVDEGLIDVAEALDRIPVSALGRLQAPVLAREQKLDLLGEGTPAAPGVAIGRVAYDSERAQDLAGAGEAAILVRPETSPEDIEGILAAVGIVTAVGGRTSHAAVVARGIGRPAVCGVPTLEVDLKARRALFGDREVAEGEEVTIDGSAGTVVAGAAKLVAAQPEPRAAQVLAWCDEWRRVEIVAAAPEGYARVEGPEAVAGEEEEEEVLIDLEWEGPESQATLDRTVAVALEMGAERLALVLPDGLAEGDVRPPSAPWTHLVADPASWPARLLATRMRPR